MDLVLGAGMSLEIQPWVLFCFWNIGASLVIFIPSKEKSFFEYVINHRWSISFLFGVLVCLIGVPFSAGKGILKELDFLKGRRIKSILK
jgi:hypothetical protein